MTSTYLLIATIMLMTGLTIWLTACSEQLSHHQCGPYELAQLNPATEVICDREGKRLILLHQGPDRRDTILPFSIGVPAQPVPTPAE